jgi:hypothetical protein
LSRLLAALAVVAALAGAASAQSAPPGSGPEVVRAVLTSHPRWILYWDRGERLRPGGGGRLDEPLAASVEFMSVGRALLGRLEETRLLDAECEFEAAVTAEGFAFVGCWGPARPMIYDPGDREHPFKGRLGGTSLWLAPAR